MRPKVPGYVTAVPVVENATVSKGQVLATIDDGDYRNAVDAATTRIATQDATVARIGKQVVAQNAAIDQTRAMLQSAKADATRAASTFERADSLVRSTYGTQQKLDDARADRDRTVAAVANADANRHRGAGRHGGAAGAEDRGPEGPRRAADDASTRPIATCPSRW